MPVRRRCPSMISSGKHTRVREHEFWQPSHLPPFNCAWIQTACRLQLCWNSLHLKDSVPTNLYNIYFAFVFCQIWLPMSSEQRLRCHLNTRASTHHLPSLHLLACTLKLYLPPSIAYRARRHTRAFGAAIQPLGATRSHEAYKRCQTYHAIVYPVGQTYENSKEDKDRSVLCFPKLEPFEGVFTNVVYFLWTCNFEQQLPVTLQAHCTFWRFTSLT